MTSPDWIVLTGYLIGTVFIGVFLGRLVKNASDMFAAGGQSPWWISGLSAFMTMFSANTFVVWGGVAYKHGLVAVVINIGYGIAALLVGFTVAGRWKRLGIQTPAEYVELRFGRGAVHFYTWFMMIFRIVGTGGALYAIARLIVTVIYADQVSGMEGLVSSQLNAAILVFALIVVGYTMIGGLWAVLMTDTLQFIILNLAVLFVIPLSLAQAGGFSSFFENAPDGFFNLVQPISDSQSEYTWLFLIGWITIHYFMIGAEWAFVQRYLCVPSEKAAKKSSYLFGVLYLLSPILWLLPPMLWRVQSPIPAGADAATVTKMSEAAYILSCKSVLPTGMLGLMLAALFSATASMISSQINVFSGVLTRNIYEPWAGQVTEKKLILVGRVFTLILGLLIAAIAITTPYLGGAAKVIITVTQLMVTPLLAPTLFALFFRNIGVSTIAWTVGICFPLGLMFEFIPFLKELWIADTTFTGVILPLIVVMISMLLTKAESRRWTRIYQCRIPKQQDTETPNSQLPLYIVSISIAVCALTVLLLIFINQSNRGLLAGFGITMAVLAVLLFGIARRMKEVR